MNSTANAATNAPRNAPMTSEQREKQGEVWLQAWLAVATATNCLKPEAATKWADQCLLDWVDRFQVEEEPIDPIDAIASNASSFGMTDQEVIASIVNRMGGNWVMNAVEVAEGDGTPVDVEQEAHTISGDRRNVGCRIRWPECVDGEYDPRCCRFPKSCSCGPH